MNCLIDDKTKTIVVQNDKKKNGFRYRLISINSIAGNEPAFQTGSYDQPILLKSINQVIEIVEDKEVQYYSTYLSKDNKQVIRLNCSRTKDGFSLSFPEYYTGIDLSRIFLLTREGIPLYFGTGNPGNKEWAVKDWDGNCKTDQFCDSFVKIVITEE